MTRDEYRKLVGNYQPPNKRADPGGAVKPKQPRRKTGTSAQNPEEAEEGKADNNNPQEQIKNFILGRVLKGMELQAWFVEIEEVANNKAKAYCKVNNKEFTVTIEL